MRNIMAEVTITNWDFFGTKKITIDIQRIEIDGEIYYNPALVYTLDDFSNQDISEDEERVIIISTDYFSTDVKLSAFYVAKSIFGLFEEIDAEIYVIDESGNIIESYNLNTDFDEYYALENIQEVTDENIEGE